MRGFEQSYSAKAAVETKTLLMVMAHNSQAPNDKREIPTILSKVAALQQGLGQVASLLADNGYFNAANVKACEARFIEAMSSMKREAHHIALLERFAADAKVAESDDPVVKNVCRMGMKSSGLRKQTVELDYAFAYAVANATLTRVWGGSPTALLPRSGRNRLAAPRRPAPSAKRSHVDLSPTGS